MKSKEITESDVDAARGARMQDDHDDESDERAERKSKRKEEKEESLAQTIKDTAQFLREVAIEFRKISWPGRQQVLRETGSVLFLVTVITVLVLSFDWGVGKFVFGPLGEWARHLGGGIGAG